MAGIFRCEQCGSLNRVAAGRAGPKCGACNQPLRVDGAPAHLTDDQLASLVSRSPVPVLVDFYADWCAPCRALSPILEQLASKYAGKLLVAKVDTERHTKTASALGVQGIPAVYLYRGGQVVDSAAGYQPLGAWERFVGPHLG